MLTFTQDSRRAVAVPLGGIGTGQVALRADGSHDQWQLPNTIDHRTPAPDLTFGLRAATIGSGRSADHHVRTLQATPPAAPDVPPQDSVDWRVPPPPDTDWALLDGSSAEVHYPFVRIAFTDEALPIEVSLEACTPFAPTDLDASSLPLVDYRIELTSRSDRPMFGFVVMTAQNTAGWDATSPVDGVRHGRYGGNVNRLISGNGRTAVLMDNPTLPDDDPFTGEQLIWTDAPCFPIARADGVAQVHRAVESLALIDSAGSGDWSDARLRSNLARAAHPVQVPHGPSAPGRTWDAALCAAWQLEPGGRTTVRFLHAWRFPNRYLDFLQQYVDAGPGGRRLWLGNHYATRFATATEVVEHYVAHEDDLRAASRSWADAVTSAALPDPARELLERQPAAIRNPTLFRAADGQFFGHEGGNGTSNEYWSGAVGGSCPLSCSHVWNYAQAPARLFPELERAMRDTEWAAQAPEGYLPHRIVAPTWLPQYHGKPIGGPKEPALDGMLGAVLKTYREARNGGGVELLDRCWAAATRTLEHVERTWHTRGDGILRGPQPTTFDYPFTGPNMFVGSLWLAALAAMRETAQHLGRDADHYEELGALASAAYDKLLWNGEYYEQVEPGDELDYGPGCLSDQLLGQWWAHRLELGHLLDPERVRAALRSVLHHNDRRNAPDTDLGARAFADPGEGGLLNCTWPHGGRTARPVHYCDESWSGTEYQVAAHCLDEGLRDEGLALAAAALRRHDGTRRNPFNEIECGDHYVRAMSGWSVIEAAAGLHYDALSGRLRVDAGAGPVPVVAGSGWGVVSADDAGMRLDVRHGEIRLDTLAAGDRSVAVTGSVVPAGEALEVSWAAI